MKTFSVVKDLIIWSLFLCAYVGDSGSVLGLQSILPVHRKMKASVCSLQTKDNELIPASRNESYNCSWKQNCLPGKWDSCDFTPLPVAVFTLLRLKVSVLVPFSASMHGKSCFQTVNHCWGSLQLKNILFSSKHFCWFFYHLHPWSKELEPDADIFTSSLLFLWKIHPNSGRL